MGACILGRGVCRRTSGGEEHKQGNPACRPAALHRFGKAKQL